MASHGFRYDAFISYAHEDAVAVEWLHELLRTYWVPGRRQRTIFLDRHSMRAGGGLGDQLRTRLRESRFLIVCWSRSAMTSPWITLEIDEFLKTHPRESVLVCSVGDAGDDPPLPEMLSAIERETNDPLYRVDIRNFTDDRRAAERSALSLLAPLVDLPGKDEILDRRKKRRILAAVAIAASIIIALAAWYAWKRWLDTPNGQHYLTVRRVLDAAEHDTVDDPKLVPTAEALAKTDGAGALDRFSRFVRDDDFRALVLAAGYASLPRPDCVTALRHARGVEVVNARLWPRAILVTERVCSGNVIALARPETPDGRWLLQLARADLGAEVQRVRSAVQLSAEDEVRLAVELKESVDEQLLRRWIAESDAYDVYFEVAELLVDLDVRKRLREASTAPLLDFAYQAAMAAEGANSWVLSQSVAASLAGSGRAADAKTLLENRPGRVTATRDPNDGRGWAWRGLAQQRLGDRAAQASFAEAFACGRADIPASRTWGEWRDITRALALAGDWKGARLAADAAGVESVRIAHNFLLLEDWAHR